MQSDVAAPQSLFASSLTQKAITGSLGINIVLKLLFFFSSIVLVIYFKITP